MKRNFSKFILDLAADNGSFKVLQLAYGITGAAFLLVAGVISLINQPLGWGFLIVPIVCFAVLGVNTIAWALIRLLVDSLGSQSDKAQKASVTATPPTTLPMATTKSGNKKSQTARLPKKK